MRATSGALTSRPVAASMSAGLPHLQQRAEQMLSERRFADAHKLCMQILQTDPQYPAAYYMLANIAAEHDQHAKAAEVVARAIRVAPNNPTFHAFLGRCLIAMNRQEDAVKAARHAASLNPKDAQTLDTIGVVLSRAGRHAQALPFFRRATKLSPRSADYHYNLAASAQFSGAFDEAETAYRTTLTISPQHARARSALSQLRRASPQDNGIEDMTALFSTLQGDAKGQQNIGHAIAKELEDLGEWAQSFAWLQRAKQARRAQSDRSQALLLDAFEAASDGPPGQTELEESRPIFVAGMPRTGTTLVERILSSHPDVVSAGELSAFALATKQATGTPGSLVLDGATLRQATCLSPEALLQVATNYLSGVPSEFTQHKHFIDKMPFNFFYARTILAALPNARVIVLRRNPLDTILSNYRQLFSTDFSYYQYALDLEWVAEFYVHFHRLCTHLAQHLPVERFMQIHYEEVVTNLDGNARELVRFVGLPWDAACLDFHNNEAPVATASSVQVRQPLYTTSMARWRRYGRLLDPARRILDKAQINYE